MKQLSIIVFAAVALMFTACGGAEKKAEEVKEVAKEVVQEVKASASETTLTAYEELITKVSDVATKAKAGDAAAIKELVTLNAEVTAFAETNKDVIAAFTEEETAKYTELGQKLLDVAATKATVKFVPPVKTK